ncbi:C-reactive protein isoform X1 [Xenopus tropicalis]|uniref:Pentraxin family member n=1 Tax=Xenopus tropicalis TaxID=8364 RepID=A0A8J1INA7_XENTR|nr:C-reactive protein isoform X1 [Xenopus tropicalis]XP_031747057.1 C-reactive protein isoform X1 [Xenopus tropicalis]
MEMRVLWLLLFAGSMAQEDMNRNIFFFPKKSVSDYVVLKPVVTGPLNNFTVCLRSYTDAGNSALFTLGTPKSKVLNMFVIYQSHIPYSLPFYDSRIYIHNTQVSITGKAKPLDWNHICVTWDSNTGVLQLWVNGKLSPLTVLQKGFSIDLQDGISLGQMQKYLDPEWDPNASFQGEITDVHMWNKVLPPEEIEQVQRNYLYTDGNVVSWRSLRYTIIGDVIVQPKLY